MNQHFISALRPAVALSLFIYTPAYSLEIQDYLDRQIERAKELGVVVTYGGVEQSGPDSAVISDIGFQTPEMATPAKIERISVNGIEELGGDSLAMKSFTVEGVTFSATNEKAQVLQFSLANMAGENLYYPDPADNTAALYHYPESSYRFGATTVTLDGKTLLSGAGGQGTTSIDQASNVMQTGASFDQFKVDLTAIDDPKFNAQRSLLGYDTLTLGLSIDATWDMNSGRINVSNYSFGADEAGKLTVSGTISGLTEDMARRFRQFSNEAQSEDPKKQQLQAMRMMAMMSELVFEKFALRYDDNSLTDKVLDIQAKSMGTSKQEFVQMLPAMIPAMTARLGSPEFSAVLGNALGLFLANPGNLTVQANPIRPLPLTELIAAGSSSPQTLIEALNLTVQANN